jgi:hypothetical protein
LNGDKQDNDDLFGDVLDNDNDVDDVNAAAAFKQTAGGTTILAGTITMLLHHQHFASPPAAAAAAAAAYHIQLQLSNCSSTATGIHDVVDAVWGLMGSPEEGDVTSTGGGSGGGGSGMVSLTISTNKSSRTGTNEAASARNN